MTMNIAKINKKTKIVENLETAPDLQWVKENSNEEFLYVAYDNENPAYIGLSWSEENGFEQLDVEETSPTS